MNDTAQKRKILNMCHILGFKLESDKEANLDNRFRFRKLLPDEKELLKSLYPSYEMHYFDWESFPYCIENKEDIGLYELSMEVHLMMLAIQLFSGYKITQGALFTKPPRELETCSILSPSRCEQGWGFWKATEAEIERLKEFWKIFQKINVQSSGIWRRYFNKAICSGILDALINLTIAMENILLPDTSRELRYKFALRASLILRDEYKAREYVKKIFRNAYDQRSKAVHGGNPKFEELDFLIYLQLSRKLICVYLENKEIWKKALLEIELGKNRLKYNLSDLALGVHDISKKKEKT